MRLPVEQEGNPRWCESIMTDHGDETASTLEAKREKRAVGLGATLKSRDTLQTAQALCL